MDDEMPRRKLIPDEETYTLSLRLPLPMKEKIEANAINHRRSLNQEVISLLKIALEILEKEQSPKAEG
jgi:hypothetical protein